MLPTGYRTFHFVSFLYDFFFSFLFLLFRFFSHYFVFVFLRFVFFFRFFLLLFSLFSFRFFSFRFFSFLFVFFRFSVYRYPRIKGTIAPFTYMYNLHTVCKSAHVNGASVVTRNAHAKYEYPASYVSKVLLNIYVVRYVGQRSLGKNIGINREALRDSLVTVNLSF